MDRPGRSELAFHVQLDGGPPRTVWRLGPNGITFGPAIDVRSTTKMMFLFLLLRELHDRR